MNKSVTFCQKDSELIKKIMEYQKKHNIATFTETVRILCTKAVRFDEVN
ncbi:MAG: hypothetical protein NC340_04265 [Ruminococcus flavefaciens]|nr:hypothetical protein [Ruminococcus flavefaciens]MCM1229267.1 hypothetical protein [Ruminococcus flavefaciens]